MHSILAAPVSPSPPRPGPLRWSIASLADAGIRADWERCAERCAATPFAEPYWQEAWQRNFAPEAPAQLCVARDAAGEIVAAWPFIDRRGVVRTAAALFNPHVPYLDLAADRTDATLLAGMLREMASRHDRVEFPMLRAEGAFCAAVRAAAQDVGAYLHEWSPPGHLLLPLDGPGGGRGLLPRSLVQNTERKTRRLEKMAPLDFDLVTGGSQLGEVFDECLSVEQAGWKGQRGSAIACNPRTRGFYRDVVRAAADRGQLGLYILRSGGRLIAFELCLRHSGTIHLLKLGFLPTFSECSPGNVLRLRLLELESGAGAKCYDFGIDSEWKRRWTSLVAPRTSITVYLPTPRGRLCWWLGPRLRSLGRCLLRRSRRP